MGDASAPRDHLAAPHTPVALGEIARAELVMNDDEKRRR